MIPRQHRLKLTSSPHFFRAAKTKNIPGLTLRYLKIQTELPQPTQFAVIIGKKVAKKAHQRNKIRRQFSHFLYFHLLPVVPNGYFFVIQIRNYPQDKDQLLDMQNEILKFFSTLIM